MHIVFNKHPIEKRGSIMLMAIFLWYSAKTDRMSTHIQSWGAVGCVLFFAIMYARYERVTLYKHHIEYRKLYLIIPQKSTIIAKHIQDIQSTTIFPGLQRIKIMTGNNTHIMFQYFEKPNKLYNELMHLLTKQ